MPITKKRSPKWKLLREKKFDFENRQIEALLKSKNIIEQIYTPS